MTSHAVPGSPRCNPGSSTCPASSALRSPRCAPRADSRPRRYYPDVDTLAHKKPIGFFTAVSPGFFDATGTRLVRGRDFAPRRAGEPPPLIVNEAMARALWPGQDPIGRCVHFSAPTARLFHDRRCRSNGDAAAGHRGARAAFLRTGRQRVVPFVQRPRDRPACPPAARRAPR